jgi:uncharacterized repeat protein (TIGR03803 family)
MRGGIATLGMLFVPLVIVTSPVQAQTETVLHVFNGKDGRTSQAGLIRDSAGNFYGTTYFGGGSDWGVVFKLTPSHQYTVLHSFTGQDGACPYSGVIRDSAGNLYGTTESGGAAGFGVVFKLDTSGTETVLHSFTGLDGSQPAGDLIRDSAGNLYGTTTSGGSGGVVFQLDASGKYTVLHRFTGGADGGNPWGGVTRDPAGNLYGTASTGGLGYGVVFKLALSGTYTVLYSFTGGTDGNNPQAGVIRDSAGNLYGTTFFGGDSTACPSAFGTPGCGVVFKLDFSGTYTVLHTLTDAPDGKWPKGDLILDRQGNLYGTTGAGGGAVCPCGAVFRVDTSGKETVLYSFAGETYGEIPAARLIRDSAGNLFGTTQNGGPPSGAGYGLVFKITP